MLKESVITFVQSGFNKQTVDSKAPKKKNISHEIVSGRVPLSFPPRPCASHWPEQNGTDACRDNIHEQASLHRAAVKSSGKSQRQPYNSRDYPSICSVRRFLTPPFEGISELHPLSTNMFWRKEQDHYFSFQSTLLSKWVKCQGKKWAKKQKPIFHTKSFSASPENQNESICHFQLSSLTPF